MEIHKNTSPRIEKLFDEARNEKPVMKMDELKNIVSSGSYPTGSSRGFTIGMNNLIVISGIVVSSFLAYMTLKVDNHQEELANSDVKQAISASAFTPSTNSTSINSELELTKNNTSVVPPGKNKVAISKSKISNSNSNPQKASDGLLASSAGNIISTPVNNESVLPAEVNNTIKKELPSNEYEIGFNDDGSDFKMIFRGNKVSSLTIDKQEISVEDYDKYQTFIDEGRNILFGKQADSHSDGEDVSSTNLIYFLDGELCKDKVPNDEKHYIFELTSSKLMVDGKEQSSDVFSKYKKLYEGKTGKVISNGSVYKFEKGAR